MKTHPFYPAKVRLDAVISIGVIGALACGNESKVMMDDG